MISCQRSQDCLIFHMVGGGATTRSETLFCREQWFWCIVYNWSVVVWDPKDCLTLGGDKVSMLTLAYPHKPLRKIKVTICNHQADRTLCVAWCLIWWIASLEKLWSSMDTKCPYWEPGVIKQPNPNPNPGTVCCTRCETLFHCTHCFVVL